MCRKTIFPGLHFAHPVYAEEKFHSLRPMTVLQQNHSLAILLAGVPYIGVLNSHGVDLSAVAVSGVTADSRRVAQGALFVALPGTDVDGHDFVDHAINCGAAAIVGLTKRCTKIAQQNPEVIFIEVEDSYRAYAAVSANYFDNPGEKLTLAAVTGTNGKTTVTYIVEDILKQAGCSVGVVGTINNRYTTGDGKTTVLSTGFTTPEAFSLQQLLKEMVDHDIEFVIMEVSSHALAQSRVGGLFFKVAAFTNLSRDHLDYHQSMEGYFQAKKCLFTDHLKKDATAVLPQVRDDDDIGKKLEQIHDCCADAKVSVISWGKSTKADITLLSHGSSLTKTSMELAFQGVQLHMDTLLVGYYNVENILSSIGLCMALGVEKQHIVDGIKKTTGAPGRLQRIATESWGAAGPTVFVDYAHTPDALEKVLSTARQLPHNELFGVFGCGGDRDSGKRQVMGGIGAKLCDVAIVTDDNPRTEDPDHIVSRIVKGVAAAGCQVYPLAWLKVRAVKDRGCVVARNRSEAITTAIKNAKKGDIVVIAGKGHEPYQHTIDGKKYFDDQMQAKDALLSWSVPLVEEAVAGKCVSGAENISLLGPVITDSRLKTEDGIFVALKGENHDAHAFVEQAVKNGARCLVVDHLVPAIDLHITQIIVSDTLKALGDLAAFRRRRLARECVQKVIGLTGSCGKTTVKEMIAAILKRKYPEGEDYPENAVLQTKGNLNNLIGLPLSLLPLGVHNRVAVLEMGMNVPGEIRRLTEIADPDISCITNIYGVHLLGLHSIEGVADAKEELFQKTKKSGVLIVNLDDIRIAARSRKYTQEKITFGSRSTAAGVTPDLWASDMRLVDASISFILHYKEQQRQVRVSIAGEHNVTNALCAAATAIAAGCSVDEIVSGLADFRTPDKRMELLASRYGFTILNDTYNANPASMEAGLQALAQVGLGKKIAVLGDMLELGDDAAKAHYGIGRCAAGLGLDFVIAYGEWSGEILRGMLENGGNPATAKTVRVKEEVEDYLKEQVVKGLLGEKDLVLFKASRGLRFETIVDCFM